MTYLPSAKRWRDVKAKLEDEITTNVKIRIDKQIHKASLMYYLAYFRMMFRPWHPNSEIGITDEDTLHVVINDPSYVGYPVIVYLYEHSGHGVRGNFRAAGLRIENLETYRNFHILFSEPGYIGNFAEYIGFVCMGSTYYLKTRTAGADTSTIVTEDMTTMKEVNIMHQATAVDLYVAGVLKATNTTNISTERGRWIGSEIGQTAAGTTIPKIHLRINPYFIKLGDM